MNFDNISCVPNLIIDFGRLNLPIEKKLQQITWHELRLNKRQISAGANSSNLLGL